MAGNDAQSPLPEPDPFRCARTVHMRALPLFFFGLALAACRVVVASPHKRRAVCRGNIAAVGQAPLAAAPANHGQQDFEELLRLADQLQDSMLPGENYGWPCHVLSK